MCLAQGSQRSDAGEVGTRDLSVSEFKVIFDLKSDIIFLVTISLCFKLRLFLGCACVLEANSRA